MKASILGASMAIMSGDSGPQQSPPWPNGSDGPLVVDGVTFDLAASTKDYSSVQVINGGVLNITGSSGAWMIIGCSGDFTVDASSTIRYNGIDIAHTDISTTAPDGMALDYMAGSAQSGDGGTDPQTGNQGGAGGGVTTGNGGGGANFLAAGDNSVASHGGKGADSVQDPFGHSPLGGAGGTFGSKTGGSGDPQEDNAAFFTTGPGGGGGYRGTSAGAIYIKCAGTIDISGTIDLSGGDAGFGGNGGNAEAGANDNGNNPDVIGGSGGGGGAGGNSGALTIRYKLGTSPSLTATINTTVGFGGAGGNGGVATNSFGYPSNNVDGAPGNPADDGNSNTVDIATY